MPRFVVHAVNFFTNRAVGPGEKRPDYSARRLAFTTDTQSFCDYVLSKVDRELRPLDNLPKDKQDLYVEMVRVAAYEIPQQLNKRINGCEWGFGEEVSALEV